MILPPIKNTFKEFIQPITKAAKEEEKVIIRKWLEEDNDVELLFHLSMKHYSFQNSFQDLMLLGTSTTSTQDAREAVKFAGRYLRRLKKLTNPNNKESDV